MVKFSVVISVYNKQDFVRETVNSVLKQTVQDFEIVIVNDGSTDSSEQVIKNIISDKITYISLPQNVGAGASRNAGIKSAIGRYIALLDGDDLWYPEYLKEIEFLINNFPTHKIFATAVLEEHKNTIVPSRYTYQNPEKKRFLDLNYFESSYKNTLLTSSSTVISSLVFTEIGMYDESIKSGQDTDLWIRIGMSYRIAFSTRPLVTYRYAPQSLFKSVKSLKERPKYEKFKTVELSDPALKKFIDLNRYALVIRGRLWGESNEAQTHYNNLDVKNLNKKQQFLLNLPSPLLKIAFRSQRFLEKVGIKLSAF